MIGAQDGRRLRGEERRQTLLDAALAVLGRDGLAGLTHRAVAEQAGVSLASISYHFAGIDDLLEQAMALGNTSLLEAIAARSGERDIKQLAEVLCEELTENRRLILAEYEAYLYFARSQGRLGAELLSWLDLICAEYAPDLGPLQRRALGATIEGIFLHAILTGDSPDAAEIERLLRLAWPSPEAPA